MPVVITILYSVRYFTLCRWEFKMNHDMSNIDILKPHFPNVTSKLKDINKNIPFFTFI